MSFYQNLYRNYDKCKNTLYFYHHHDKDTTLYIFFIIFILIMTKILHCILFIIIFFVVITIIIAVYVPVRHVPIFPVVGTNETKCDTHTQSRCWYKWGKVWHSHSVPLLVQMRQSVNSDSLPCLWRYCSSFFSPCYNRTSWLGVKHQVNSCVSWDERLGHLELLPLSESLGAGRARWG